MACRLSLATLEQAAEAEPALQNAGVSARLWACLGLGLGAGVLAHLRATNFGAAPVRHTSRAPHALQQRRKSFVQSQVQNFELKGKKRGNYVNEGKRCLELTVVVILLLL